MLFANPASLRMPTEVEALPGRDEPLPVRAGHFVHGRPITPPFPEGTRRAVFGLGCFWGAERTFWQLEGVYSTAVGYAGGFTKNPTYEEVCSGGTGHSEVVLVVYDLRVVDFERLLQVFWESHDPTQGMRQGERRRDAVPLGDSHGGRRAAARRRGVAGRVPTGLDGGRLRPDHDGDPFGAAFLPRRGVPPAVSREESRRLLRPRRHRRRLSAAGRSLASLRGAAADMAKR